MNRALSAKVQDIAVLAADGIKALSTDPDDRAVALYVAALILLSIATGEADGSSSPSKLAASLRTAANAMEGKTSWQEATQAITDAFAEARAKRRRPH